MASISTYPTTTTTNTYMDPYNLVGPDDIPIPPPLLKSPSDIGNDTESDDDGEMEDETEETPDKDNSQGSCSLGPDDTDDEMEDDTHNREPMIKKAKAKYNIPDMKLKDALPLIRGQNAGIRKAFMCALNCRKSDVFKFKQVTCAYNPSATKEFRFFCKKYLSFDNPFSEEVKAAFVLYAKENKFTKKDPARAPRKGVKRATKKVKNNTPLDKEAQTEAKADSDDSSDGEPFNTENFGAGVISVMTVATVDESGPAEPVQLPVHASQVQLEQEQLEREKGRASSSEDSEGAEGSDEAADSSDDEGMW
jgi:hypothetical protein